MMNGLETLIHPTEGFAAGESCTDTSEKERPPCVRAGACMCVSVCVRAEILRALGRCYGLVIGRRDKGRMFFSFVFFFPGEILVCVYLLVHEHVAATLRYAAGCLPCAYTPLTKKMKKQALSATVTGLQPERCMAAAPSNSAQAHPYPSALSALFNSCFMAPNSGHNDARTPVCHGGVDRLGDTLACDTLVHHFLDSL